MIVGHEDHEAACQYLRDTYRLTKEQADEVISMSESMGWAPLGCAADEAAAAAVDDLAFRWHQPYEVRRSVVASIYRRLLGVRGDKRMLESMKPPEDEE